MYPFERFSESAKGTLTRAQQEAEQGGQSYIGTEHLLLGLMGDGNSLAAVTLATCGLDMATIRTDLQAALQSDRASVLSQIVPTSRVKRIIELAFELAKADNSHVVDTGHLLMAIAEEGHGMAAQVLRDRGLTVERVRNEIAGLRNGGKTEAAGAGPPPVRQHLALKDDKGRAIAVDILFSHDYSEEEQHVVASRIRGAVERAEGTEN
jgi:ATP-dependent Clp protease ATP-binding subunit ClpC